MPNTRTNPYDMTRQRRSLQQRYPAYQGRTADANRLSGGLAPLSSISRTQPVTPAQGPLPTPVGVAGGRGYAQRMAGAGQQLPYAVSAMRVPTPFYQQGYAPTAGDRPMPGYRAPVTTTMGQAVQQFTPEQYASAQMPGMVGMMGQYQPPPQGPVTWESYAPGMPTPVAAEQYTRALELSPEAWEHMDPKYAAWRQAREEQQTQQEARQQWQQGVQALEAPGAGVPGATAPDLRSMIGPPAFDEAYWQRQTRQREASAMAGLSRERLLAEQALRRGGSRAAYNRTMTELKQRETAQRSQALAGVETQRQQMERQAQLDLADRLMQQYGIAAPLAQQRAQAEAGYRAQYPTAGQSWTGMEQYLTGAGREQQLAQLGFGLMNQPAGGGGGATGFPAFQTWPQAAGVQQQVRPPGGGGGGGLAGAGAALENVFGYIEGGEQVPRRSRRRRRAIA